MTSLLQQSVSTAPLGHKSAYPKEYDPRLLFAVSRSQQRQAMAFNPDIIFTGFDEWNCFEVLWLDTLGKPMRACMRMLLPAGSPFLPESKSLKLYLHSLNNSKFVSAHELINIIKNDLEKLCKSEILLELNSPSLNTIITKPEEYFCLDNLEVKITNYKHNSALLEINKDNLIHDKIYTNIFKSHCLCTGQPDWGSIFIDYQGPHVRRESILAYLVSFYDHQGFSENCIEQIFVDILSRAQPTKLSVFGRFTRRGGIEINPYRSTHELTHATWRLSYQ